MISDSEFKQKVLQKSKEYKRKRQQNIKRITMGVSVACTALICLAVMPKAFDNKETADAPNEVELYTEFKEQYPDEVVDKNGSMPPASKDMPYISAEYKGTVYNLDTVVFDKLKPFLNTQVRSEGAKNSNSSLADETSESSTALLIVTFNDGESEDVYTLIGDEITSEIKQIIGIEE